VLFFGGSKKETRQIIELLTNIRDLQLRQLEKLEEIHKTQRHHSQHTFEMKESFRLLDLRSKMERFKDDLLQTIRDLRFR
jgi:hypothetical protein